MQDKLDITGADHEYDITWLQGCRQRRGVQWCPDTAFEIGTPHFTFGPPVATYIQYCILKMCTPLLFFGPSFWFLGPPAAKSWRRACLIVYLGDRLFYSCRAKGYNTCLQHNFPE